MSQVQYICSVDVFVNERKIHGLKINVFNESEFKTYEELKIAAFERARSLIDYCGIPIQDFELELRKWELIRQQRTVLV